MGKCSLTYFETFLITVCILVSSIDDPDEDDDELALFKESSSENEQTSQEMQSHERITQKIISKSKR